MSQISSFLTTSLAKRSFAITNHTRLLTSSTGVACEDSWQNCSQVTMDLLQALVTGALAGVVGLILYWSIPGGKDG